MKKRTCKGKNNNFYGKKHTLKTRKLMSKNHADVKGNKHPNWQGGKTKFICDYCNIEFKRYKSVLKGNEKNIFCSKKCFFKWKKENYKSEDSPTHKVGHTKKTKKLQSKIAIERMKDPIYKAKVIKALQLKPNKPEIVIINLIQQNKINLIYSGDGKEIVGNFNPDFINKEKRIIIEVFGDYWHNLPKIKERDKRRLKTYSEYGYKTLIIWEKELEQPKKVLEKMENFIKC